MEIRQRSFNFPRTSDTGPQSAEETITFARRVLRATAGITGYSARYDDGDHHLGRITVELSARVNPDDDTQVIVSGVFGLRDWSNEWDDDYSGNLQYVVLADLEGVAPPQPGQPRGDLVIVDAEISQVIQHFRSAEHLDSANVFPDNSIRLVARKPTAVRLYVDYDATSGLPAIANLTGTLDVTSAGGATTALAPLESIVPRRDSQIERSMRQHTLNFIIPEGLCVGDITISARVSNLSDNTQFSAAFARTLSFDNIAALPVIAVGINYTGPDINDGATPASLAAPTQADFVTTLALTEKLFPVPQVNITSFVTMDYDEEVDSDINDGCDKMDDLLDAVRDMRGDSEDLVLGLFNTGLNTGSVGGCGGGGGAVGRINSGGTAAHELAHALGRQHAPCDNVTRCATPKNTDGDYPAYSGYDSDSIGEFGIDTANGAIKDPADAHDIMGYSGNRWISPYTYKGLMSRIPEQFGAASASFSEGASRPQPEDRGDWIKRKQPHLFLNILIERDRSVTVKPAFHFLAFPQPRGARKTDFSVELVDANGKVLKRACLYGDTHGCGCECEWPQRIRQAMSFHPAAARLRVFECDEVLYERDIGKTPEVRLEVAGADQRDQPFLTLKWDARCPGSDDKDFWYLVQWRDPKGTWRGAAPRQQVPTLRVPKSLFRRQQAIALRVLASSGIATGQALWEGSIELPPRTPGDVVVGVAGLPARPAGAVAVGPFLRATVDAPSGAAGADAQVRWYDRRGVEIGRGRTLDLRALRPGFHTVTAAVLDTGNGYGASSWTVEHRRDGQFYVHFKQPTPAQSRE